MARSAISGINARLRKETTKQKKIEKTLELKKAKDKALKDLEAAKKKTDGLRKAVAKR